MTNFPYHTNLLNELYVSIIHGLKYSSGEVRAQTITLVKSLAFILFKLKRNAAQISIKLLHIIEEQFPNFVTPFRMLYQNAIILVDNS